MHYFFRSHDDYSVVALKPVQRFHLNADFCNLSGKNRHFRQTKIMSDNINTFL